MPDTAASIATDRTVTVDGGPLTDTLDSNGDHDWFKVTLVAGQTYTFYTTGVSGNNDTSTDTTLALRDPSGHLIAFNDDWNNPPGQMSKIQFTATVSGTYYLDVGGYNDVDTGAYQIHAVTSALPALPIYDNDEIALQLTDGFWGNDPHHHDVAPGGSLDVIIDSLNAAGQSLARTALELWSDVLGITFNEVASGSTADITFIDTEAGAYAETEWSGGIITSATVNISTAWISTYGTGFLNSYSLQTYVHEIGHALGLGHAGDYNGSANYPSDALYANDAWPTTVMSYFDASNENDWFADQGFTSQYTLTPMVADIIAAANLYGARGAVTRTGDTTYGFNNTSGRAIYDPAQTNGSMVAIVDDGGTDTLDYSQTSAAQLIWLEPELISNVLGRTGNLVIARGTVIENARGGSGSDIIVGNAANNVLTGGAGMDVLYGEDGNDTLDGGSGNDEIDGGAGNDTILVSAGSDRMSGGSGGDTFVFGPVLAFMVAPVISDLDTADVIDLNTGPGDAVQLTSFIGDGAFTSAAGQYRYFWSGGSTVVEYDGDGDGAADGSLEISNGEFVLVQFTNAGGAHNLQIENAGGGNNAPQLDNPLADQNSDEDTAFSFSVPATAFSDPDSDPLTYSATLANGDPLPAWLAFDPGTRTFSGTPPQDFNGAIDVRVTAADATLAASDTFTLTITPVNDDPTAVDDSAATTSGATIAINVLANDNDVDGDALTPSLAGPTTSQGGTVVIGAGNVIDYTAPVGFTGSDTFTYTVSDGNGGFDMATVTVTVSAPATSNIITGTPNSDVLNGTSGVDEIYGLGGADTIEGRGGDDIIEGGGGADSIDGGSGNDTMRGGTGNDFYIVSEAGDVVEELPGEGEDAVRTYVDYVLPDNVEHLDLRGAAASGTGNALDNDISASAASGGVTINGLGGHDYLRGSKFDDTIDGGDGNDRIFGDDGTNTMYGGLGRDSIVGGSGTDTMYGEDGNDVLVGNGGADYLDGGAGQDKLNGSAGNDELHGGDDLDYLYGGADDDLLFGDGAVDYLYGGTGTDELHGGDGNDKLRGEEGTDILFGDAGTDQLYGGDGDDILWGGAGQDFMDGEAGADRFMFDEPDMSGNSSGSADRIRDFSQADGDLIDLSAIDAITGGSDDAFTFIGDAAFSKTAGELRFQQFSGYTMVQMDTDGDGATDLAVRLEGVFTMVESDFAL